MATVLLPATAAAEVGFYGWGPRIGVADDPDQFVVGLHQDLGEIVDRLHLQPSIEAGFGDDHTVVSGTIPVHYRFQTESGFKPYAGGGVRLAWIDRDRPRKNDSEFDIAPVIVGGIEWPVSKGNDAFVEFQLSGGDAHDAKLVFGWMFRAR